MSLVARPFAVLAAVAALVVVLPDAALGTPRDPRLAAVKSFAFAIGAGDLKGDVAARYGAYGLVIVDGQEATSAQVAALQARGMIVLAYLSVGTIEPFRPWYGRLKRFRLPDKFVAFNEYYANLDAARYRARIAAIAARILGKGFDGLFLDNTDMTETHRRQKPGMFKLARRLSWLTHRSGRLLFTQNGAAVIAPTLRFYDGWNREDASWTYSFSRRTYVAVSPVARAAAQAELRRIGAAGLLTLATDYTAPADTAAIQDSVANACGAGALPFVSDIELTRIPSTPLRC